MEAFRIRSEWVDALVFGTLIAAGIADLLLPWHGIALGLALCLCAYGAAWELSRWLMARGYQIHESMATTLAALIIGFGWYLSVGYNVQIAFPASRWVEVAITLGLMMEALMVCIAAIGILSARHVRPLVELGLGLGAGLIPGLLAVPAVLLCGSMTDSKLALPSTVAALCLWATLGRRHLCESEKRRGHKNADELRYSGPLVVLGAAGIVTALGHGGALPLRGLVAASVAAAAVAAGARIMYDRHLLPQESESNPELHLRFLGGRVVDRLPEFCALSAVLFICAKAFAG